MGTIAIRPISLSALENEWQRRATAAAIAAARKIVSGGTVPPGTPIGRLSEVEWGWIAASILFGWISTRAEQATAGGWDLEETIRLTGHDPNPWDAGAVATILPKLADAGLDWSRPLEDWPQETMVEFLVKVLALIRTALIARDLGGGLSRRSDPHRVARETNAAAGGPLLAPDEIPESHL
jgi:hypothetical protein